MQTAPASTISSAQTVAKIGRRMKKSTKDVPLTQCASQVGCERRLRSLKACSSAEVSVRVAT